jgi:hypothetical protein
LLAHREYTQAENALSEMKQRIHMLGGAVIDREQATRFFARKNASASILKQEMDSIEELGVQVKDLEIGLIDFPTLYRGEEVLLCWKLGEARIDHWHGLTEGFRGRKPIDDDFTDFHHGDLEN